jgi:hypothetical protein
MPPIPEDAVVIADYMLMADHVLNTGGGTGTVSKGVRRNNISRDFFFDSGSSAQVVEAGSSNTSFYGGFQAYGTADHTADNHRIHLPSFATKISALGYGNRRQIYVNSGSAETQTISTVTTHDASTNMTNAQVLGTHVFKTKNLASQDHSTSGWDIASPIHTSSHYQTFETPFLHELVGGDRNMEQTNLVVTPDGKTWDEVTRDVSYLGNTVLQSNGVIANSHVTDGSVLIFDDWRGMFDTYDCAFNKDWAIAYDRVICLVDGFYEIALMSISGGNNHGGDIAIVYHNGILVSRGYAGNSGYSNSYNEYTTLFKRGDTIQIKGDWHSSANNSNYRITRLK